MPIVRWLLSHLMLIMLVAALVYLYWHRESLGLVAGPEPVAATATAPPPPAPLPPAPSPGAATESPEPAQPLEAAEPPASATSVATASPTAPDESTLAGGSAEPEPRARDSTRAPDAVEGAGPPPVQEQAGDPADLWAHPFASPPAANPPAAAEPDPATGAAASATIASSGARAAPELPPPPGGPVATAPPGGLDARPPVEPPSPAQVLEAARRAYWEGRLEEAAAAYRELLDSGSPTAALYVELGSVLAAADRRAEAADALARAVEIQVDQGRGWETPALVNQVFALDYGRGLALERELARSQPPPAWR